MSIEKSVLELLVCPLTRMPLIYDRENNELVSPKAKVAFPVRDDIPIMLASAARKITK